MWERRAGAQEVCETPKRFLAYMFANGTHKPDYLPPGSDGAGFNVSGDAWQLPVALQTWQDLKSDLVYVSGLENQERRKEFGDHAIGCGALLTARKPTKDAPRTNMSVDQAIADKIQECHSGIHSLQLGTHNQGFYDVFGTFYTQNISWRGEVIENADGTVTYPYGDATPLGKENDPRAAFDRLFAGSDPDESEVEAARRRALRQSVLDTIVPHGNALRNRLNAADRAKLEELFTGIRALEQEIDAQPSAECVPPARPREGLTRNDAFLEQLNAMHDLMVVAFQCDITRVITFMQTDALSDRNFAFVDGVDGAGGVTSDHAASHHTGDPAMVEQFRHLVNWKMEQIGGFVRKMKEATDLDGAPILDNSLLWIGSELGDGNLHDHRDLSAITAGKLGGLVTTDRHVRYAPGGFRDFDGVKTYGDYYLNLLDLFGIQATEFGDDGVEAITWHS